MTRKINFISQFFLGRLTVAPFESHPTHRRRRRTFSLLIQLTSRGSENCTCVFRFRKVHYVRRRGANLRIEKKNSKMKSFYYSSQVQFWLLCVLFKRREREKEKQSKKWKTFSMQFQLFFSLSFVEAARQVAEACRTAKGWARKFKLQISVVSQPILIKISFAPTEREFAAASERKMEKNQHNDLHNFPIFLFFLPWQKCSHIQAQSDVKFCQIITKSCCNFWLNLNLRWKN